MPDAIAIAFEHISKVYRMYNSIPDQALDVLGLSWLRPWRRNSYTEFPALTEINLKVRKGERIGIVGRNGAGKTTLLKLITGNFAPTSGEVRVNGTVQALMHVGLGFHPEFTGYENIRSALAYSGLSRSDLEAAIDDVIDFVELDKFLHQPMKTYSTGMQARLMFAAATAIKPDILIVDEILGAGDAYFSAKSAHRMEKLTSSGCTLLLVSHSMQQVLQFCEKAIWLDGGEIIMEDEALPVVKAYEERMAKLRYEYEARRVAAVQRRLVVDQPWFRENVMEGVLHDREVACERPVGQEGSSSPGGVSRWPAQDGLKINSIRILDGQGAEISLAKTGKPLSIEMEVVAQKSGKFTCTFLILLFTPDGRPLTKHVSNPESFVLEKGDHLKKLLKYDELRLGNGEYVFSAAIYKTYDPAIPANSERYDLLSRSFWFKVVARHKADPTVFHHPAVWL